MRARGVVAGGLLLVIGLLAGAVALWVQPTEFGWFAYAGSVDEASPRLFLLTARRGFALALAAVALLLLGAVGGFAIGRGRRPNDAE